MTNSQVWGHTLVYRERETVIEAHGEINSRTQTKQGWAIKKWSSCEMSDKLDQSESKIREICTIDSHVSDKTKNRMEVVEIKVNCNSHHLEPHQNPFFQKLSSHSEPSLSKCQTNHLLLHLPNPLNCILEGPPLLMGIPRRLQLGSK